MLYDVYNYIEFLFKCQDIFVGGGRKNVDKQKQKRLRFCFRILLNIEIEKE